MNEEAKKLLTEYRCCEAHLELIDRQLTNHRHEYKQRIKDSFTQDGNFEYDKITRTIVAEEDMIKQLKLYIESIRQFLMAKYDIIPYYKRIEISDEAFGIEPIKGVNNSPKETTSPAPDFVKQQIKEIVDAELEKVFGVDKKK